MYEIEIADLQTIGVNRDQEGYILPPEAMSYAMNLRVVDDGLERIGGQEQLFGTPGVAPHFTIPIANAAQTWWLYTSLTKAYVYDGSAHTNITRQTAAVDVNYTATETRQWNACLLGGVPILNNGVDPPQFWSALNPSTKLVALTNWPGSTTAAVIRAFGPYLFALNLTESGTSRPHVVRWSHPADPGTVPASWDYTDATKDAGRTELADVQAGIILDGLGLGSNFYIYKEGSTWRVTLIGGNDIFDFKVFLETSGILAPRCVTLTGDGLRHVVATKDDLIVHDGTRFESILDKRFKKYLFNNIDTVNFRNAFIYTNPFYNEVIFCYPEPGFTNPNRAVIWNYKLGGLTEKDVNYRNAITGPIETGDTETWAAAVGSWDSDTLPWSTLIRRKVVLCGTDATKFFQLDKGTTRDGSAFTGLTKREGISVVGRKRNGDWIVDFSKRKILNRVWIKATGGPISVRIGFQEQMNGAISWSTPQTFNPTTQHYVDQFGSGRAVSVEFSAAAPFKILSYKLVGDLGGGGL